MHPFLERQLEHHERRLDELDYLLSQPDVAADMDALRRLSQERADVAAVAERARRWRQRQRDRAHALSLFEESRDDPEMQALARAEVEAATADVDALDAELQRLLLPRDPDDRRNAYVEIRAGTGGDESALFAAELLRMYTRYAERRGWQATLVSAAGTELGGLREAVLHIEGEGAYGALRFESGGHRVQRVPATETQGRIHTSACTVAVLPEAEAAEAVKLNPAELRIDTFRASGAGGQHINKTDSAVRVTHLPTGLTAECQDGRSQHSNKAKALQVLAARLQEKERRERAEREAATRRGLIGSGDRSDRIRTYNFPQGRVTDHRINLTLYQLGTILDGDLDPVITALDAARASEQLAALQDGATLSS